MQKKVYNPETKSFEVLTATAGKREETEKYSVSAVQAESLRGFAKADGMDMSTPVRQTNAIKQYIGVALQEFIDARIEAVSGTDEEE